MNLATIKKILVTLGQIMAYAVRHGYIDYNPVRDAERPRGNGESEESKIRVLTPAEINSFLDAEIDFGPSMMAKLKEWKLACPRNDNNLVFPNKAGNPINHNNLIQRHFYPALKNAELPKIRFHAFVIPMQAC